MRNALLPLVVLAALAGAAQAQTLRVLTYNVGLLTVAGSDHVPMVRARAARAPELVASEARQRRADVILLEEVWKPAHAQKVRAALEAETYTVVRPTARGLLSGLTSGLLLAVRKPLEVVDWSFARFRANTFVESLARKGVLQATVRTAEGRRIALVCVHMIALDIAAGTPSVSAQVRAFRGQVEQALAALSRQSEDRVLPALVLGEFNVGPGYADAEYRLIAEATGLTEAADLVAGADAPTWDPENPLVKYGRYPNEPAAKIDHVFLVASADGGWRAVAAERRFMEPVPGLTLDTPDGQSVPSPLSDHYGFEVMVRLEPGTP